MVLISPFWKEKILNNMEQKYDGNLCTSSCGKDYDCPHEEAFELRKIEAEEELARAGQRSEEDVLNLIEANK